MTAPIKKSTFGKTFNQENGATNGGYATDDASSDGEQQSQLKVTSRFSISKLQTLQFCIEYTETSIESCYVFNDSVSKSNYSLDFFLRKQSF